MPYRWDILAKLSRNPKVGAEIGVMGGHMTLKVLDLIPSIKTYYAIDPWQWYPTYKDSLAECSDTEHFNNQEKMDEKFKLFKKRIEKYRNKVKILRMFSNEAAGHIKDRSLDFVFIDGNHSYEYVKEDIQLYLPKVKKNGLIGGHDYDYPGIEGVKKAVDEFFNPIVEDNNTWWHYV